MRRSSRESGESITQEIRVQTMRELVGERVVEEAQDPDPVEEFDDTERTVNLRAWALSVAVPANIDQVRVDTKELEPERLAGLVEACR